MQLLDTLLVFPIINLLVAFYQALSYLHVPFTLGFAIIAMTLFIRLLMAPMTGAQIKMSKKMQEMAPHLKKIKEKHKSDMQRQQQETMALYKQHGVNPAAGCLPGIVQIVILVFGLYPALLKILHHNPKETLELVNSVAYFPFLHLQHAMDTNFFGMPLEKTPAQLWPTLGVVVFLIPVVTGALQFIQSKMMMPLTDPKAKKVQDNKAEDFMTTFQKQSMYLIPIMVGVFSYTFSVGLSLYWNSFTIFGIIQQYRISGWGSLGPWIEKLKTKKN